MVPPADVRLEPQALALAVRLNVSPLTLYFRHRRLSFRYPSQYSLVFHQFFLVMLL
jgi:hypothetical protein